MKKKIQKVTKCKSVKKIPQRLGLWMCYDRGLCFSMVSHVWPENRDHG